MGRKLFRIGLIFFILFELCFTFAQHYHISLDGDMAAIVVPSNGYSTVLHDPFGMNVLLHDSIYPAPNRYFAHLIQKEWFQQVPLMLQSLSKPVDSVYLSSALLKTLTEFTLILLLGFFITGKTKLWDEQFLIAASLIAPLFQTYGYSGTIGIIDHAPTYVVFYPLSTIFILIFFFPLFQSYFHAQKELSIRNVIIALMLALVISFNGALNSAIVLLVSPMIICHLWLQNFQKNEKQNVIIRLWNAWKQIGWKTTLPMVFIVLLSLYSFYIGRNNAENNWETLPLAERFARLPMGLFNILTRKAGFILLILSITINFYLIRKWKLNGETEKLRKLTFWILAFIILYTLLLPFGGYRSYRPNIIRRDTYLPVILSLFFLYGYSTLFLLRYAIENRKKIYVGFIILFTFIFFASDLEIREHNACERKALEEIAASELDTVKLSVECKVLSWGPIYNPILSETNAELLKMWRITKRKKLYFSGKDEK